MDNSTSSYRQILKATTLFGGVQVVQVLVSIVRSKVVAVLLGPLGMGILGLLTTTVGLINSFTNFGLNTSAVRNIAEVNASGNVLRIATIVKVLRRWVWITGLIGTILTFALSPLLSQITFGNYDYTYAFMLLSVTLLMSQLSSGQMVVLQGMRRLKDLARAGVTGSVWGLIASVPLYYVWGIDAIVPTLLLTSLLYLAVSTFYASKIELPQVKVSKLRTIAEGKSMLIMGFMISLSSLITIAVGYLTRIYIAQTGGIEDVGLYTAGFSLLFTYVGMIFNAMSTDFYPRLSAVANDVELANKTINEQAEIAILILAPIIVIFLVFVDWVILLLFSSKFLAISEMVHWAVLGMFFKAASWSMAHMFLAKADSKLFFLNELLSNVYFLILNIVGFKLAYFSGLGIAYLLAYLVYTIQVFFITRKKYSVALNKEFIKIFSIQFVIAFLCFLFMFFLGKPFSYIVGGLLFLLSIGFSYEELDKRLEIAQLLKRLRK